MIDEADSFSPGLLLPLVRPDFQGCDTPGSGGVPNPAVSYTGPQVGQIGPGQTSSIRINNQWNGRIFNQNGGCGAKGEGCTVLEYNLGKSSVRRNSARTFYYCISSPPLVGAGFDGRGVPFCATNTQALARVAAGSVVAPA